MWRAQQHVSALKLVYRGDSPSYVENESEHSLVTQSKDKQYSLYYNSTDKTNYMIVENEKIDKNIVNGIII